MNVRARVIVAMKSGRRGGWGGRRVAQKKKTRLDADEAGAVPAADQADDSVMSSKRFADLELSAPTNEVRTPGATPRRAGGARQGVRLTAGGGPQPAQEIGRSCRGGRMDRGAFGSAGGERVCRLSARWKRARYRYNFKSCGRRSGYLSRVLPESPLLLVFIHPENVSGIIMVDVVGRDAWILNMAIWSIVPQSLGNLLACSIC